MKRLNKEYKLDDICHHVSVKYGSVNKDNPQVVYISGKCWIIPQCETDYENIIEGIEKHMRKDIKMFLIDGVDFDKRFILDFDINTDNISVGERKFLSFDFYVKQNEKNKKSLKELKGLIEKRVSTIVNNMVYLFQKNNFIIRKNKK